MIFTLVKSLPNQEVRADTHLCSFFFDHSRKKTCLDKTIQNLELNKLRMHVLCPTVSPFKSRQLTGSWIVNSRRKKRWYEPPNPANFFIRYQKKQWPKESLIFHKTQNKALEDLCWIQILAKFTCLWISEDPNLGLVNIFDRQRLNQGLRVGPGYAMTPPVWSSRLQSKWTDANTLINVGRSPTWPYVPRLSQ